MATRNKRKLAAMNKENCEEHPRSNLASNSNVPRSQEDYDSQSNPHPEADLLTSVREDRHDMATGVQRESAVGQDITQTTFFTFLLAKLFLSI